MINRGQSAPTFPLSHASLILPSLLVIILPDRLFLRHAFALLSLNTDSELVVMSAAGFSRRQLAVPVFIAAAIVMALTYLCSLYLMPVGQRAMKDKVLDIRADIGAAILQRRRVQHAGGGPHRLHPRAGTPTARSAASSCTTTATQARPVTYLAESGVLAQTPAARA